MKAEIRSLSGNLNITLLTLDDSKMANKSKIIQNRYVYTILRVSPTPNVRLVLQITENMRFQ